MTTQWHPLFAELLRPMVQDFYEVYVNMAVGDVPREADLVLLRRTTQKPAPFQGLWRHLTSWNILEYKGPSVSARCDDLDLLLELGLGIYRRLNDERAKHKHARVLPADVSFWYLVNRVGERFRRQATKRLGDLHSVGDGIWRGIVLERSIFLVSGTDVPVEHDSVPLHLLGLETPEKERTLARLIAQEPPLWQRYGQMLAALHPNTILELRAMAKTLSKGPKFHLLPLIELIGMQEVIDQVGVDRVIQEVGLKRVIAEIGLKHVIEEVGLKHVIEEVGLKHVIEEIGLKQVIEEVGLKQVIDEVGLKQVIDQIGIDRVLDEAGREQVLGHLLKDQKSKKKALAKILDDLSPAERADLKRRLT